MLSNISFGEFLLIEVVALVLFGPKKLPEIGRALGKAIQEIKNGAREIMEDKPAPIEKPVAQEAQATPIEKSVTREAQTAPTDKPIVQEAQTAPIDKPVAQKAQAMPIEKSVTQKAQTAPIDKSVGMEEKLVEAVESVEKPIETQQKRVSRLVTDNPRRLPD
jgi:sec-independent protein translocase protein TatA